MSTEPTSTRVWLKSLGALVATNMPISEARERLATYAPLLEDEFPPLAFNAKSLQYVAALCRFFPAYSELRDGLKSWWDENGPPPAIPQLADDVAALSRVERSWVRYWQTRRGAGFAPLRGTDGSLSRPEISDWRSHCASLIRAKAHKAWAYIQEHGL